MHDMLKKIIAQKEREVAVLKQQSEIVITRKPKDFKKILAKPDLSFITEIKRRSPSKGSLAEIKDPAVLLEQYVDGGADAISVLTDEQFFGGSLADCETVAAKLVNSSVCVLRKDFLIDEKQIAQSIEAGADIILLIVAVLGEKTKAMLDCARMHNVSAIVEVHTTSELELAVKAGAEIIGINNRNLDTFEVDIENCLQLIKRIPDGVFKIAESAIYTEDDISRIKQAGFDAVLIGEALVTAEDPCQKLQILKAVS